MHLKKISIDYQLIICVVRYNGRSAGSGGCREGLLPLEYGSNGCFCLYSGFLLFLHSVARLGVFDHAIEAGSLPVCCPFW